MKSISRLFISVIMVSAFLVPHTSLASTVEDLQAQINSLLATIASLQAQLNQLGGSSTTGNTSPVSCRELKNNLKFGDKGDEVTLLQEMLVKAGYRPEMNGEFGEETAAAVSGFQLEYKNEVLTPLGLTAPTAYVGKLTRAKLNKLYGCGVSTVIKPLVPTPPPSFDPATAVCAQPPMPICQEGRACIQAFPGPTTYANEEAAKTAGATILYKGICVSPYTTTVPAPTPLYAVTQCDGSILYTHNPTPPTCTATTTPAITILSPNGGESFRIGDTATIKWKSNGYTSTTSVQLELRDTRPGPIIVASQVIGNTTNTGTYTVTIPEIFGLMTVGAGNVYKIRAYIDNGGDGKYDDSDKTFSITSASTITLTGITPQSGPVGTTVYLSGCGPESALGYDVVYSGPKSGSAKVDVVSLGSGCGYMQFVVPADFPTGTYTVSVKNNSTGKVSTNSLLFTVTSATITATSTPITLTGITPQSGPIGTVVYLSGCGPESALGYNLIYSGPKSGSEKIDVVSLGGGCGYMQFDVPTGFPAGIYTLSVKNNSTGKASTNTLSFTVTSTTASTPITLTGITPQSGPIGTTVYLTGCGPESALGYNLIYTGPKSGSEKIDVVALGGGCGYMSFAVPTGFPTGVYTLSVKNNSTGAVSTNSMTFTITASAAQTTSTSQLASALTAIQQILESMLKSIAR